MKKLVSIYIYHVYKADIHIYVVISSIIYSSGSNRIAVLIRNVLIIGRDFSYFSSLPGSNKKAI
jgi:hypothetical protein